MITSIAGSAGFHLRADFLHIVGDDRPRSDAVSGFFDPLCERRAGFVVGERTRVRHGQHRDLERDELPGFVDAGHEKAIRCSSWPGLSRPSTSVAVSKARRGRPAQGLCPGRPKAGPGRRE
jgi:hypothetical protein